MDLREELPEDMAHRMLKFLSVLKYAPECSVQEFQAGVITGDKSVVYQSLAWLLPKVEVLKTRAYLGKFLVRLEVPDEILQDDEVERTYQEYCELLEEFKNVHKSTDKLKNNQYTAADIKRDITQMEQEYEQLQKTIERKKARVESMSNMEELLGAARNLRREQERQSSIAEQRAGQKAAIQAAESKVQRLMRQLKGKSEVEILILLSYRVTILSRDDIIISRHYLLNPRQLLTEFIFQSCVPLHRT